jgi:hypothetical protein
MVPGLYNCYSNVAQGPWSVQHGPSVNFYRRKVSIQLHKFEHMHSQVKLEYFRSEVRFQIVMIGSCYVLVVQVQ